MSSLLGGIAGGAITGALISRELSNKINDLNNKMNNLKEIKWAAVNGNKIINSNGIVTSSSDAFGDLVKDDKINTIYIISAEINNDITITTPNKMIFGSAKLGNRYFIKEIDKNTLISKINRYSGSINISISEESDGIVRHVANIIDGVIIDGYPEINYELHEQDELYKVGPAINVTTTRGLIIKNAHFHRNEYGIKIGPAVDFAHGNASIHMDNIILTYNVYGIHTTKGGWLAYIYLSNIKSYLNQYHCMYIDFGYNLFLNNIDCEMDQYVPAKNNMPLDRPNHASVYINGRTMQANNINIHLGYGNIPGYIGMHIGGITGSMFQLNNIMIEGTKYEALNTAGPLAPDEYYIYINNIYTGWLPPLQRTSRGFSNIASLGQSPGIFIRGNAYGSINNAFIVTNETTKISIPATVTTSNIITR